MSPYVETVSCGESSQGPTQVSMRNGYHDNVE